MRRNVEMEIITHDIKAIEEASTALIINFVRYSEINGAQNWLQSLFELQKDIRQQKPQMRTLSAEGIDLSFSGFTPPIPIIEENKVIYKTREPRFIIEERPANILPSERMRRLSLSDDIAMEMGEVYYLDVQQSPLTLIFPKNKYTQEILRFEATIL